MPGRFWPSQRCTTAELRMVCMFSLIIRCKSRLSRPVLIAW
jgi:hypothetical protein